MGREINRSEVDRRIDRLHEEYGDVPVTETDAANDPDFFQHGIDLIEEGFVGGAAAWIHDDEGRVLMIRFPDQPEWGVPGGGHEPGETLAETAKREAFEEVGVRIEPTDLFHLVRKSFYPHDDPERRAYMVEAWFEADHVGGDIALVDDHWDADEEIVAARWMDTPPDRVIDVLEDQVADWDWPGE